MHGYIVSLLLLLAFFITLLSYPFSDQLVLKESIFVFWLSFLRISTFVLAFFLVIAILVMGSRFTSKRFYFFALFFVASLIPDFFHILFFPFLPDFITKNIESKAGYLFLLSNSLAILSFYVLVFYYNIEKWLSLTIFNVLLILSFLTSFGIIFLYPILPSLYLVSTEQPFYSPLYSLYSLVSIALYGFLMFYVLKNRVLEESAWYLFGVFGFLSLSSFSLIFHKHPYDFQAILASIDRLIAYILLTYVIMYNNVRKVAIRVIDEVSDLLEEILKVDPIKYKDAIYIGFKKDFSNFVKTILLYDLETYKLLGIVSGPEEIEIPKIDLERIKKLVKDFGGYYSEGEFHYKVYKNYLFVSHLKSNPESPIARIHITNLEVLMLGFLLEWINFKKLMDEKTKEIERLYLLLQTSEYVTQAYNDIDIFSKRVVERLDYTLKMDGSFFYIWDKNENSLERIIFSNSCLENFSDSKVYELLWDIIKSPEACDIKANYMYCKFDENLYNVGIVGLKRSDGFDKEDFFLFRTIGNQVFSLVKIIKVIEDLERAHSHIMFLTKYDSLTMLYNKKTFEEFLEREIEKSNIAGEPLCIIFMDVDNFTLINTAYGYHVGDVVLRHIGDILKKKIRKSDIAARVGKDEFCILLPNTNRMMGKQIAEEIQQGIMDNPLVFGDREIHISLTMGVLVYPYDAKKKEEILLLGESLLAFAKRRGRGRIEAFEEEDIKEKVHAHLKRIEGRILEAFEKRAVEVFLQEIVSLYDKEVAFEALMRLKVDDELLPAGSFIYLAEETDVIKDLDRVLLEKLFQKISTLGNGFKFFINLSPKELTEEFIDFVVLTAEKYRVKLQNIVFEITEREAIQDMGKVVAFVKDLKSAGFKFALDDFGGGYASFIYLKYLPVDFLKIDGEFIKSIRRSSIDRVFVKGIINIAKELDIKTVAEYVEDGETMELLHNLGIDYAQGYYIGKPEPMEEKLQKFFSTDEVQLSEGKD
ncbi:MAG: EAL domain-containing protein [Caldimicrobium sp.]